MVRERVLALLAGAVLVVGLVVVAVGVGDDGDDVALESDRTTTTGEEATTTTEEELERSTTTRPATTSTSGASTTATSTAGTAVPASTVTTRGTATTARPATTVAPTTTTPTSADLQTSVDFTPSAEGGVLRVVVANNGRASSGTFVLNVRNPGGGLTYSVRSHDAADCAASGGHAQCIQTSQGRGGRIMTVELGVVGSCPGTATIRVEVESQSVPDPDQSNNVDELTVSC